MYVRWTYLIVLTVLLLMGGSHPAIAQRSGQQLPQLDGVELDEQLGEAVPQDVVFRTEDGEDVALRSYFDGETPVLLNLVYHDCPMLCSIVLDKLTATMAKMEWVPGEQFTLLTVSFNATETPELARQKKVHYLEVLGKPEAAAGWHFLTGDEASIDRLTDAVGFRFRWVEEQQQFAHPEALVFLSGEGTVTRYIYGLTYPARDVRAALVEASEGTVGTPMDKIFLYCFQYDPLANSYVPHALNLMKAGGVLTVLVLGTMLLYFWRRERRKFDDERVFEYET